MRMTLLFHPECGSPPRFLRCGQSSFFAWKPCALANLNHRIAKLIGVGRDFKEPLVRFFEAPHFCSVHIGHFPLARWRAPFGSLYTTLTEPF